MSRLWQVFCAPGPEDQPLPVDWIAFHAPRCARIPLEHWELIEELATAALPDYHEIWELAHSEEFLDRDQTVEFRECLSKLHELIGRVPPLSPEVTEDIPENMDPEAHQMMVATVIAVLDEALRLEHPFDAWVD